MGWRDLFLFADPSKKIARLAEKEIPFALNQNTPIW
jgi:hypothetical protein